MTTGPTQSNKQIKTNHAREPCPAPAWSAHRLALGLDCPRLGMGTASNFPPQREQFASSLDFEAGRVPNSKEAAGLSLWLFYRQRDDDFQSLALLTFGADLSAVREDDGLGNRESQPRTARAALDRLAEAWGWGLLFLIWTFWQPWAALIALVWMLLAAGLARSPARTFALLVQSAFDLYRWRLYEAIRWPLPEEKGPAEIAAGQALTRHIQRGL